MIVVVTIVAGAVLGVLAQVSYAALNRRYAVQIAHAKHRLLFRWGRLRQQGGADGPRQAAVLPQFFRETGPRKLDVAIYELSLRPAIPLMDLLYFEYLKQRLIDESITRVFVFPWSGGNATDPTVRQQEHELETNLKRVFVGLWEQVTFVTAKDLSPLAEDIVDGDFFQSLEALGDSTFLRDSSRLMGFKYRSYHDINSGHPDRVRARSLVEHAVRGWLIFRYLEQHHPPIIADGISVGCLIWDRELSKLLLLTNLVASEQEVRTGLLLGRSVGYRRRLRRRWIPTYEPDKTIEVFGDPTALATKCAQKSVAELSLTREIAHAILGVNDALRDAGASLFRKTDESAAALLSRHSLATYESIAALRRMYGVSDAAKSTHAKSP